MADGVGVYRVTGSVEAGALFSSSKEPLNDLNVKRRLERTHYDRLVMGQFVTGSNIRIDSYRSFLGPEDAPSWTQLGIGLAHAFFLPALSSSNDFTRLNAYGSGS